MHVKKRVKSQHCTMLMLMEIPVHTWFSWLGYSVCKEKEIGQYHYGYSYIHLLNPPLGSVRVCPWAVKKVRTWSLLHYVESHLCTYLNNLLYGPNDQLYKKTSKLPLLAVIMLMVSHVCTYMGHHWAVALGPLRGLGLQRKEKKSVLSWSSVIMWHSCSMSIITPRW